MAFNSYFAARGSPAYDARSGDPAYARDRQAIDQKLKSRFERIFEKYAKDFSSVGDEIDIESGKVVVNNGHLTHMQHERDTGKSASAQFLREFEKELDKELDKEHGSADEEDEVLDDAEDDEDGDGDGDDDDIELDAEDAEDEGEAGDTGDGQAAQDSGHRYGEQDELTLDPLLAQSTSVTHPNDAVSVVQSTEATHSLPSIPIGESLNSLVPHQDASGRIDPAAIHALGQNIANQIAQFLMSASPGRLNPQPRGVWEAPPLPSDAFQHASFFDHHRDITPLPDRYPSVLDSPSAAGPSIWAPTGSHAKRRKLLQHAHHGRRNMSSDPAHDSDGSDNPFRNKNYSRDEDNLIKQLRDERGMTWSQITTYMPGRTKGAVSARYTRALKHLSRPVVVKREVIEIIDGEDDMSASPEPAHIPGNVPGSGPQAFTSPRRPPPKTPLLRQALENQIARHGDSGDLPINIGDDVIDTDSNYDPRLESSTHIRPDGHGGFYRVHQTVNHLGRAMYSPASSSAEEAHSNTSPGPSKTSSKTNRKLNSTYPRYGQFSSSKDVGNFGILRTENPAPMNFVSQEQMLGPMHSTTGAFGVLKFAKEKTPKKSRAKANPVSEPKRLKKSSKLRESRVAGDPLRSKNPMRPRVLQEMDSSTHRVLTEIGSSSASLDSPAQHTASMGSGGIMTIETPSRMNVLETRSALQPTITEQDEGNDGDVSEPDFSATPAQIRYRDAAEFALHNEPYFLSNLSPVTAAKGRGEVHVDPHEVGAPTPKHLQPPSSPPPLPTPRSDVSVENGFGRAERLQPQKDAPPLPGPGGVAVMTVPSAAGVASEDVFATPKTPITHTAATTGRQRPSRSTPTAATRRRQAVEKTSTPAKRKSLVERAVPVDPAEGSEDELAL